LFYSRTKSVAQNIRGLLKDCWGPNRRCQGVACCSRNSGWKPLLLTIQTIGYFESLHPVVNLILPHINCSEHCSLIRACCAAVNIKWMNITCCCVGEKIRTIFGACWGDDWIVVIDVRLRCCCKIHEKMKINFLKVCYQFSRFVFHNLKAWTLRFNFLQRRQAALDRKLQNLPNSFFRVHSLTWLKSFC